MANLKNKIKNWFDVHARSIPSVLHLPVTAKDYLLNEDEQDSNIHLMILPEYQKIPRFDYDKKKDVLAFYYMKEKRVVIRWKGTRCVFENVEYEGYEDMKQITDELENGYDPFGEDDPGEYGFGGDWWKS